MLCYAYSNPHYKFTTDDSRLTIHDLPAGRQVDDYTFGNFQGALYFAFAIPSAWGSLMIAPLFLSQ